MQSTHAFLNNLLARYDWMLTFSHSPDFAELMKSNAAPTNFQSYQLRTTIQSLDPSIREIQSDIDLLHSAAAALEVRMSRLTTIRNDYRGALSPIRRLPAEIIAEILCATREYRRSKVYNVCGFDVFNLADGPWYLGRVCRAWRVAVETSCPDLWSELTVEIPDRLDINDVRPTLPFSGKNMMALLERALERSRNHHLDFSWRYIGYDPSLWAPYSDAEEDVIQHCFDLLLNHSTRWRSVELSVSPSLLTRMSRIRGRVDILQDMYLTCEDTAVPGNIDVFEFAPKLKTLHLTDVHPEAVVKFPSANLITFLDAKPLSGTERTPEYLDIIASCSNLLSFSYHHHSEIPESLGSQFPIARNTSLQSLSASLGNFLSSLDLPMLKRMTVRTGCDLTDNPELDEVACPEDALAGLHALILRSGCSLTVLHLIEVPTTDDQLLSIIQLSPQLLALTIEHRVSSLTTSQPNSSHLQHLFRRMTATQGVGDNTHHILTPSLKKIVIVVRELNYLAVEFLDEGFVDMIASRRSLGHSSLFEKLRVMVSGRECYVPFLATRGQERLHALAEDGLRLQLIVDDRANWVRNASQVYYSSDSESE